MDKYKDMIQRITGKEYEVQCRIGNVLEKYQPTFVKYSEVTTAHTELIDFWQPCGFTKSLQQILEDNVECDIGVPNNFCSKHMKGHELTPQAENLFSFLTDIFND